MLHELVALGGQDRVVRDPLGERGGIATIARCAVTVSASETTVTPAPSWRIVETGALTTGSIGALPTGVSAGYSSRRPPPPTNTLLPVL